MKVKAVLTLSEFAAVERAICNRSLLGASTIGATAPDSYAPASQKFRLPGSGRVKRRWSLVRGSANSSLQLAIGTKSIAWLPDSIAIVCVGPPLFCNPSGSSFSVVLLFLLVPLKPQLLSSEMLYPSSPTPAQLPPLTLFAKIELLTRVSPTSVAISAPSPAASASFPEKVVLETSSSDVALKIPPPAKAAFPAKVSFRTNRRESSPKTAPPSNASLLTRVQLTIPTSLSLANTAPPPSVLPSVSVRFSRVATVPSASTRFMLNWT